MRCVPPWRPLSMLTTMVFCLPNKLSCLWPCLLATTIDEMTKYLKTYRLFFSMAQPPQLQWCWTVGWHVLQGFIQYRPLNLITQSLTPHCKNCTCVNIPIDVAVTSQWTLSRLKSPASQLFVQPFVQAHIKENIKALRHWPLWGETMGDWWIPGAKGQ